MARPRRNAALPTLPLPGRKSEDSSNCEIETQITLTPPVDYEDVTKGEVERYKLVVLGDEECGKTALLNTLVKSADFEVDDSFATFDECVTDVKTTQEHVEFTLYEITGMDDYRSLRLELCRGADVFLVCFDIGRPCTLRSVERKWSSEITQEFPDTPFLLIGCKNDLRTDSAMFSTEIPTDEMMEDADSVSRAKAEKVSQNIGAKAYVECCAKTRWNVDHVFKAAAEAILTKDDQKTELLHSKHNHSVLRRFSRLATDKHHSSSKRGSIFSFVVGSNA
ncbi:GTP-binding protein rhoA-like [Dendronephthya gigantea]|uniref:GTP-binding protein rhoA-like n=1 Tax=Dendronephthya gigantea TaxID=151771 RepID=UPI00106D81A5|nr:GTP-binding protein rhoA-like [Dendronephthya gigantea]